MRPPSECSPHTPLTPPPPSCYATATVNPHSDTYTHLVPQAGEGGNQAAQGVQPTHPISLCQHLEKAHLVPQAGQRRDQAAQRMPS